MRPNPLREKFAAGEPAIGGWLAIPSSVSAEVMATAGLDYVCIDLQHGLHDYSDAVPMLQALSLGGCTPTVRVPWNEPGIIGKVLDAGAMAVIVPMVNSRAECEAAVRASRYAPEGARSFGPVRVSAVEGADYATEANAHVTCIPMIETREAVESIDEILSVPGVEAIYVGPADLAISLGHAPGSEDPEFHRALTTIVDACGHHDVVPGIHATAATAAERLGRGFRMITVSADLVALRNAVAADVATARGTTSRANDSLY